jgi:hypothetical protein
MSQSAYEQVVGKMLLDVEFRKQMTADMNKALSGFDLTSDEIAGLKEIDLDESGMILTGLDERVSKRRKIKIKF